MPRTARIVVAPAIPYHVTQRGNRRNDVFFSDEDRRMYLNLLRKYSEQHGMDVLAYCCADTPPRDGRLKKTAKGA